MTLDERMELLHVNIGSLHSSVAELHSSIAGLTPNISELHATAVKDGENIRALARIAEIHERRLTDLEDGSDVRP